MPSLSLSQWIYPQSQHSRSSSAQSSLGSPTLAPADSPRVGIYGLPGSGKTFLLDQLRMDPVLKDVDFLDGSALIGAATTGGLAAFQKMDPKQQTTVRQKEPVVVWTDGDAKMYTHIIYFDVASHTIAQRRARDSARSRDHCSIAHLEQWKKSEMEQLRDLCAKKGILFAVVSYDRDDPALLAKSRIQSLLVNFHHHSEDKNWRRVEERIDSILTCQGKSLDKAFVFDADKTLTTMGTGTMFFALQASRGISRDDRVCPLKALFSGPLQYTYTAFRQASILFGEPGAEEFDALCEEVALTISVHPEVQTFIQKATSKPYITAMVVTCGQQLIWDKILDKIGLADSVKVIGAGRAGDPSALVIDANIKANIVKTLKKKHGLHVVAIGDSPLDLPMMEAAHEAIVVVGPENSRSVSMEAALENAIKSTSLTAARQVILPRGSRCRLSPHLLPIIQLDDEITLRGMLAHRSGYVASQAPRPLSQGPPHEVAVVSAGTLPFKHATDSPMAKLLMTPMRDANVSGPALREAHRQVGHLLSVEYLTGLLGLEKYPIPHVQAQSSEGYRLYNERSTGIIALMRGGEPMAIGVNDAFPSAALIHVKEPKDLRADQVKPLKTVILVDSVINSGRSITEMIHRIRSLAPGISIAVVAASCRARLSRRARTPLTSWLLVNVPEGCASLP
ncbi:uracil phosphoribosyltransferase-domain-containing protein [Plectosphaerella plurivora]|uniref:Uracil phosphoribosyltransferase-domain-containing protein n=1 Tax=Plectosphaerella plurivora TaxID=936078 RepID=A0A9P9ABE9_9PEZI|nr:uracil phosphoribosyltransferase-domain-containing protein [Plectosphaerella plurivora]